MTLIPPEEKDARLLFDTWGYDTIFYEKTALQTEVLLRFRGDNTLTIRKFDGVDRWIATDSDAWRS